MRILLIEDEKKTARSIRKGLVERGFTVDMCADGDSGLRQAMSQDYDGVVLDLMLPVRDGWSVISELRREGGHVPILVLTARDAVQDRVRGLELGADDYLVKPFAFSELFARIESMLRRGSTIRANLIRVGDLVIDESRHRATRAGIELELTAREFALLLLLARNAGHPLSRTLIAEKVWGLSFDTGTNVIDVHVRNLRSKVDDPFDTKLIRTLRGVGYVLSAGA
ncbi:MAG: heavy metal response regulator transcription factor [Planctomycetes bacterium]|nr:heavy metal response regulator transcription factor [Planctomycetota bacterium]